MSLDGKPAEIQAVINKVIEKMGLTEDEVVIMLYGSKERWVVWFYPSTANLNHVEGLLVTATVHLKQLKANREKAIQEAVRSIYTC